LLIAVPTIQRVAIWADPVTFWKDCIAKTPPFGKVRLLLAAELINAGEYSEAETQLDKAFVLGLPRDIDKEAFRELQSAVKRRRAK
jgi:hypothetical protein